MKIQQIKDLLDNLNKTDEKRKFLGVLEMTLKEFVDWIELREKSGVHNNKPYRDLYNVIVEKGLLSNKPVNNETMVIDLNIATRLNKISIANMKQYVDQQEYKRYSNRLTREVSNLGNLYTFEPLARTSGRQEWEKIALKWKAILINNLNTILEECEEYITTKWLPSVVDTSKGITANLHLAIKEFLDIIKQREGNPMYAKELVYWQGTRSNVLHEFYVNHLTIDQVMAKLGKSYEMVRKCRKDFLNDLIINPKTLCVNLHVNELLSEMLNRAKLICIPYHECPQEFCEEDLELMGYDMVKVTHDVNFVVLSGERGNYSGLAKCAMRSICDQITPAPVATLKAKIMASPQYSKFEACTDSTFIENILSCDSIVEKSENGVRIKAKLLQTHQDRAARMMYDHCLEHDTITKSELLDMYFKKYGQHLTTNISTLRRYGFAPTQEGGVKWRYATSSLPTMQAAVRDYAEHNILFHYNDIKKELIERGYSITDSSLRTYITNVCKVDSNDSTHFCLKAYSHKYPQFNSRKKTGHHRADK